MDLEVQKLINEISNNHNNLLSKIGSVLSLDGAIRPIDIQLLGLGIGVSGAIGAALGIDGPAMGVGVAVIAASALFDHNSGTDIDRHNNDHNDGSPNPETLKGIREKARSSGRGNKEASSYIVQVASKVEWDKEAEAMKALIAQKESFPLSVEDIKYNVKSETVKSFNSMKVSISSLALTSNRMG